MRYRAIVAASSLIAIAAVGLSVATARADGNINAVNHIIIVMQENHSFDNYFGALPYTSGSPYHPGPCRSSDHSCVDGLSCFPFHGNLFCFNFNFDENFRLIFAFHDNNYCPGPDLQHDWQGSHMEANFFDPAEALLLSLNDGFVAVNAETEQVSGTPDFGHNDTMGYYNQSDLPFYYGLAQTFAMSDRHFCSVVGPTLPNRSYEMAATSFGHVTTNEIFPPGINPANPTPLNTSIGYQPITGSIFDLLDAAHIQWFNYFEDLPTSVIFRGNHIFPFLVSHVRSVSGASPFGGQSFMAAAAAGTLPPVSFVDPSFAPDQLINGSVYETDEHPPFDIRAGQYFASQVINAVRNGPNWKDTVILFTYDEHGGFYDHVRPPAAAQGGALNPDGIDPGLCEDLSNPPLSLAPGGGAQCDFSESDVAAICSEFTPDSGPYPPECANFNQLGFRVPFVAISPFAKPHYVSHTVTDHTSMLAFIEQRFLGGAHLTLRDANANPGLDMFDFTNSPSLGATVPTAPAPVFGEHNCPFVP